MVRDVLAVSAALLLAVPTTAGAAANVVNRGGTLTYTGTSKSDGATLSSAGATVRISPRVRSRGCTSRGYETMCRRVKRVVVNARGGRDLVHVDDLRLPALVYGGSGDDQLTARLGDTELRGGPGDDLLDGSDRTRFSGGPGIDVAGVGEPKRPLTFASGQFGDDVEDVRSQIVAAVAVPATIVGNARANHLSTGNADDVIVGGAGRDVLSSGPGDDTIDARDGEPDRVRCDLGNDTVLADEIDQVADSCERTPAEAVAPAPATLVNRDGTLTYTFGSAAGSTLDSVMSLLRSRAPGYDVSVLAPSLHQPLAVEGCLLVKDRYECAGVRSAIVIGGPGPDRIFTDVPATVLGGPGPDELFNRVGGAIDGGPGDDQLTPAKAVTVAGGTGIDTVLLRRRELAPLRVTFDGVADDGLPGEAVNVLADVEDVLTEPEYDRHDYSPDAGPRTMVGTHAANHLFGSYGDDAISGGKGSDELYGMDGDDRLDARDGEPDRIVCGDDDDVALVDPVDLVSATCERVIRTP